MSRTSLPSSPAGIPIEQLVRVLRRHAGRIALCTLLGAAGAYAYAQTLPKSFTATSLIAVEGDRLAIPELSGALRNEVAPDPLPRVRTEMQAVASRDILMTVVDRLHLVDVPEFNPALRPPTPMQRLREHVSTLLSLSAPAAATPAATREAVLGAVSRALLVFQDNRSLVIELSFTAQDPKLAASILNTLVSEYVAAKAQRRVAANQGANAALTERIDQVRNDLAAIETQMRELRTASETVNLRAGSIGQQQLEELATAATRAGVERAQLETTFERASSLARAGASDALASVLGSPTVSRLREQEGTAAARVAELSTRYGPQYPGVRAAEAELASARRNLGGEVQRIVSSLGTQVRVARSHEADVKAQLEAARRSGVNVENVRAKLEQLQQEAVSRRTMYQTLLERAQQTVVQPSGTETPDVRVLSQAAAPIYPSAPNTKLAGAAGGMAGLMLGGLLALTGLRRQPRLRDAVEYQAQTGTPATATMQRAWLGRGRGGLAARVVADSAGPEAQAIRAVRAGFWHAGRSAVPRSVVVTGLGRPGFSAEIAMAIARLAALDGDRALFIEGDLLAPTATSLLGLEAPEGTLVETLERGAEWRDGIRHDPGTPLDLLAASGPSPRSHALLSGGAFQNLLIEAQAQYDLVILTAPAPGVADTTALAQRADLIVLVVDGKAGTGAAELSRLGALSRNPVISVLVPA